MFRNFLNSKGFTLVEVLASVVLLAVVLSIALSVFPNMFRTNEVNEESLDSVAVAKDALVRAKGGALIAADFKKISDRPTVKSFFSVADAPPDNFYTFSEPDSLGGTSTIHYVIDPTNVDGLGLFEITIYIVERSAIRATNYGYLDSAAKPTNVIEVPAP